MTFEVAFKEAMAREGLVCLEEIKVTEGSIPTRFKNNGRGNRDCWYFWDGTTGTFGHWREAGKKNIWSAYQAYSQQWTTQQREDYTIEKQEQKEKAQTYGEAAEKKQKEISNTLSLEWETLKFSDKPDPTYRYLMDKKVLGYGIRYGRDSFGSFAAVPLRDNEGTLYNLQKIYNAPLNGLNNKWFVSGARKKWCFHVLGESLETVQEEDCVYVCEGYATGASIYEATKATVIVAFDAGNLKSVVSAIREKYSLLRLIIAADNDQWQGEEKNTGLKMAYEVAQQDLYSVVYPTFRPDHSSHKPTDFNDLHILEGLDAVKEQLKNRVSSEHLQEIDSEGLCQKRPIIPHQQNIRSYKIIRDHKTLMDGVYYFGNSQEGEALSPLWLCSPLEVTARTTDGKGHGWGYLLEWEDDDKRPHCWPVPAEMLVGQGEEHLKILSDGGVVIATNRKAKDHLVHYIRSMVPDQRARCTDHLGWHSGVFVLPEQTIGEGLERIIYQPSTFIQQGFQQRGTLEDWRQNVSLLCRGNSRSLFAMSCAFAPILMNFMEEDSGGFNLYGESSSGKTTLLRIAASVWGSPSSVRRWRATANGLEGLAQQHNDSLLILDELAQVSPKEAGESAYTLGNGSGKTRCSREGIAKKAAQWRLLYLSSGEITLADHVRSSGQGEVKAGQEIRLVDIPVDAGYGMGAFETLHGCDNASTFSRQLTEASSKYYGTAVISFVEDLIANQEKMPEFLKECRGFAKELIPIGASGQVERVAMRFALVALGGELASYFEITGWDEGEAEKAVKQCFKDWLKARGSLGNLEIQKLLSDIRACIEAHQESRFSVVGAIDARPIINRIGYIKEEEGERFYIILPEMFKRELCKGHNSTIAIKILKDLNILIPDDADGKPQRRETLSKGNDRKRYYVLRADNLWRDDVL